jgi:hypothetical protein
MVWEAGWPILKYAYYTGIHLSNKITDTSVRIAGSWQKYEPRGCRMWHTLLRTGKNVCPQSKINCNAVLSITYPHCSAVWKACARTKSWFWNVRLHWRWLTSEIYVAPCSLAHIDQRFTEAYWLRHQGDEIIPGGSKHLWNVGQYLPDYTAHPRRQSSSYSSPSEPQL